MICPNCSHTMPDSLAYCECCGSYLAAPQPKMRVVSTSTYRLDLYDQPEGGVAASASATAQGTSAFYNLYESAPQPQPAMSMSGMGSTFGNPASANSAGASVGVRRASRRSRRMRTLFTATVASMLLLGFSGGMTAFAIDDADSRMPLVVEYEELVAPEALTFSTEGEDGEVVTILDDPVPMASPTHSDSTDPGFAYIVEPESEPAPVVAPAPLAGTLEQSPAEPTVAPLAPCTLDVNGTRVPYIHSVFASVCPDNNAALWAGADDTTDGSYGYFIGHNPGDFACVFSLVPGDYVTLCDSNGALRNYTVQQLYDVPNTIFFKEVAERLIPTGESLVMQTCIGDGSSYRIVVCE